MAALEAFLVAFSRLNRRKLKVNEKKEEKGRQLCPLASNKSNKRRTQYKGLVALFRVALSLMKQFCIGPIIGGLKMPGPEPQQMKISDSLCCQWNGLACEFLLSTVFSGLMSKAFVRNDR